MCVCDCTENRRTVQRMSTRKVTRAGDHQSMAKMRLFHVLALFHLTGANLLFKSRGDLNIGVLIEDCLPNSAVVRTLASSAVWTVNRLNTTQYAGPLHLGLSVFQVCRRDEYYSAIFQMFESHPHEYLLGMVVTSDVPAKVLDFADVLDVRIKRAPRFLLTLIQGTVKLLNTLNLTENITVVAPNQAILREFYRLTRREWMCVSDFLIYENIEQLNTENFYIDSPFVIFGNAQEAERLLKKFNISEDANVILVPLDGHEISGVPDGSYIFQPPYYDFDSLTPVEMKILPTPLLFEIANPIIAFTSWISDLTSDYCNTSEVKLDCFKSLRTEIENKIYQPDKVLNTLKIEPLANEFIYNIFKVENVSASLLETNVSNFNYLKTLGFQNYIKLFSYNVLDENLTLLDNNDSKNVTITAPDCMQSLEKCLVVCENFKVFELTNIFEVQRKSISLRPEPWVFAFLSLSALGVLFCICIMIFIVAKLCKRQVLEGNPILTICLILTVLVMFCGVIPFSIEGDSKSSYGIYMARSISVTIPYSIAFALLLSRSILLATVSKEVGFMSHVAGPVQSFLAFFIFAVQCALSLQLYGNCEDVFRGISLVYLLAYNVLLLVLLIFITPVITRSQRNYKEGKYFTISVMVLACCWSGWLPAYAVLDEDWKDPLLCLGLVSTAGILLGGIFIPRTYLITISSTRDRFTSALPSLATATSAMDIYRASTQPVYDCVNVAALSAANSLRSVAAPLPPPQPNFYSASHMVEEDDEDEDFDIHQCNTPPLDKVTRF